MKFSAAAVLALAAGASAYQNVTYVTEVVTALTTFCPAATTLTHAGVTYTVSEATTLTITDCPCTVTKPVYTSSSVDCPTCTQATTLATAAPIFPNGTATTQAPSGPAGTGNIPGVSTTTGSSPASGTATPPVTAGAGKTVAMSGAGLAGALGLAAFFL